ncbi:hypothetical protein C8N46_102401 [Kordia periserrulae]|uniref:Uncharacterized protein n=1 Tax=Kordia periserrulae TaxID=701523 RepID=A0A2T6C3U1_9FLAO|nr:hypothetical protein C8N46_102401 [Kordia periserrulae]
MRFLKILAVVNTIVFAIKTYFLIDGINFTLGTSLENFLLFERVLLCVSVVLGIIFIVKRSKLFWVIFSLLPFLFYVISLF